jgi:hypothetical protein
VLRPESLAIAGKKFGFWVKISKIWVKISAIWVKISGIWDRNSFGIQGLKFLPDLLA